MQQTAGEVAAEMEKRVVDEAEIKRRAEHRCRQL